MLADHEGDGLMNDGEILTFWVVAMLGMFYPRAGFALLAVIAGAALTKGMG